MTRSLLFLLPLLVACGSDRADTVLGLEGDATAGELVFADTCASCHGVDGTGGTGPDLTAESEDDAELVEVILYGDGEMPAQDQLTDQEVADVVAFVQSIATGGGDED